MRQPLVIGICGKVVLHAVFSAICITYINLYLNLGRFFNLYCYFFFSGGQLECNSCNKWFSTSTTLLKHKIWHHKNEFSSFKFNCSECPYASNVATAYKRHLSVHDLDRPYFCSVCGNRFIAIGSLSHHMLIHTGEQNYNLAVMQLKH